MANPKFQLKATGYDKYVDWKIFLIPIVLFFLILILPTPYGMKDVGTEYQLGPKKVVNMISESLFNKGSSDAEQWQLIVAKIMEQNLQMGALTKSRYIKRDIIWCKKYDIEATQENFSKAKSFVETHDISISLSYHDYGEFMIFPWMHSSQKTPHESLFRSIGENMSKINKYDLKIYGQYGEREYLIPRFQGTPGSSENWLYGEHEIIAYTMELCKRRPERDESKVLDACWKHVGVNLYVCERAQTVEDEKTECEKIKNNYNIFDIYIDKILILFN